VKAPRFRVAWVMLFIAVVTIDFGVVRVMFKGPWQICPQHLDANDDKYGQITKKGSSLLSDWHPMEE
jgi:hypothetical protein